MAQMDCSTLADMWQDTRPNHINGAQIMMEIIWMTESLLGFGPLWTPHEATWAAHLCVKEALNNLSFTCFDVIPRFLNRTLQSDCNLMLVQ